MLELSALRLVLLLIAATVCQTRGLIQDGPLPTDKSDNQALNIISARGFIGELYRINSLDGTPLNLYHVINPNADQTRVYKQPMLLGHGLGGDAAQMMGHSENVRPRAPIVGSLTVGPGDDCLPFALSNNNFDVWLLDSRGTNKNNHDVINDLDPFKSSVYYNYSLDEQALYDLPAFINFVLLQTQSEKLHYTGYSESTFFMLALLSARPEMANKLASVTLLAPVAFTGHVRGLGVLFSAIYFTPDNFQGNVLPEPVDEVFGTGIRRFCSTRNIASESICQLVGRSMSGAGETEFSPAFFASFVKGTSTKAVKHFAQLYYQKRFGMYDYGEQGNLAKYGQVRPPDYDLSRITLPTIILVRAGNDFLSNVDDQQILLSQLGVKPYLDIFLPTYNHLDVTLGRGVAEKVQVPVITALLEIVRSTENFNIIRQPTRAYNPSFTVTPYSKPYTSPIQSAPHVLSNLLKGVEQSNLIKGAQLGGVLRVAQNIGSRIDSVSDRLNDLPDKLMNSGQFSHLQNLVNLNVFG